MAAANKILCPSCGFQNTAPLANNRCVSCGAKVEELKRQLTRQEELERRYQQEGFSLQWFGVSLAIIVVMTAALVMGLPMVIPALDFEGSAGMLVAIPVWFLGGLLIGLISPGRTFIEPVVAASGSPSIPVVAWIPASHRTHDSPAFICSGEGPNAMG